jgi:TolA-binding protein/TM2 domain-containing membrane protein YozV
MIRFHSRAAWALALAVLLLARSAALLAETPKEMEKHVEILDQAMRSENPATIRAFADRLFEEEDYYRALTVYKYALYRAKPGTDVEDLRFRIALCYEMGERWDEAETAFDDYLANHGKTKRAPEASYRIGQGYFRGGKYIQALNHFRETKDEFPDSDYAVQSQYAMGLAQARLRQWKLSATELRALADQHPSHPLASRASELAPLIEDGENLPQKSPLLAGGLSLIPGLGKLYTHHYGGALIAALVNGGLGFVVYDSFDHERYAVAGVFSALLAATYSANIVGGYRSAIRFNSLQEDKFADRILTKGVVPDLGLER